jgi:magnesium-transporting ATPase (P-type)
MKVYTSALNSMQGREQKVLEAVQLLEQDMNFIGVSGVEDKLQKNVQTTIDSLKGAGI